MRYTVKPGAPTLFDPPQERTDRPSLLSGDRQVERQVDDGEGMSVERGALVVFIAALGVLALLSLPLLMVCFGAHSAEAKATFVAVIAVAVACGLLVTVLTDALGERARRGPVPRRS